MSRTSAVETSIQAVSAGTMVGGGAASWASSKKGVGTVLLPGWGSNVTGLRSQVSDRTTCDLRPETCDLHSRVVIQEELVRMRPQIDRRDVLGALHRDPGFQHVGSEHVALEQEGVVLLQRVHRLGEAPRHLL